MTSPVSVSQLQAVFDSMKGRVAYDFGGKAKSLDEDSHDIGGIDCSGFVRFVLAKASHQQLVIPDGSSNQHDWCKNCLRELAHYTDVSYAVHDQARLFIAFLDPHPIGHVWLVRGGMTLESHGGRGVDSRPWNTKVLLHASACYEVAPVQA